MYQLYKTKFIILLFQQRYKKGVSNRYKINNENFLTNITIELRNKGNRGNKSQKYQMTNNLSKKLGFKHFIIFTLLFFIFAFLPTL